MLGCWEEGTYGRTYVKYVHTYVIDYRFYPVELERGYLRTYLLTYLLTYAHPYVRTRMNVRTYVSRLWPNGLGLTALAFCPATASLARLSQTTDPRLNVRLNVRLTGDHPPSQITPDGTRIIVTYGRKYSTLLQSARKLPIISIESRRPCCAFLFHLIFVLVEAVGH